MKRIMAVYDVDPFYADRFADVVNQREKAPFTVMAFSSVEKLKEFAKVNPVEILLISDSVHKEEVSAIEASWIITLADGETVPVDQEYPSIYKYQSSNTIIREVMACYCEKPTEPSVPSVAVKKTVIGVYSPINRCLKTSLAITLGQLLNRESKVLYINLEEHSGFAALMNEVYEGDLSDVMYFYVQGSYNVLRLNSVIYSVGGMDYIPPVRYPEDFEQINSEQMADMLVRIISDSTYDTMVIDVGQFGKQVIPVLEICNVIYMPVKEDSMSLFKLQEFENYLEKSGHSGLKEKIKKLKLPYHNSFGKKENYMEQLLWGELGDYARQLLRGIK